MTVLSGFFFGLHRDSILVGLEMISCGLNGLTMNGPKRVRFGRI